MRKNKIKVTVCQLSDQLPQLHKDWQDLTAHVKSQGSEVVLLPEMPFHPWLASSPQSDQKLWQTSVQAHDFWLQKLPELSVPLVLGTRPVIKNGVNLNQGFIWAAQKGYQAVHNKYYLPDEEGFFEATWYRRGPKDFSPVLHDDLKIGFLICTEMWFTEHARAYARHGTSLLACPRATAGYSADKWIAGGRAAAVMSGAFCLSSNRGGTGASGTEWAGNGWIIDPEEGEVLGVTTPDLPFLTLELELNIAAKAKNTYPRYVRE